MDKSVIIMINLYIINESKRASTYGIGTYIIELIAALKDSDIRINVVHLFSDKADMELINSDGVCHWHIPSPVNGNISLDIIELYYRNVVYLLQLLIKDTDRLVFQLNYIRSQLLINELQRFFHCKVLFVVHYLNKEQYVINNRKKLLPILKEQQQGNFRKMIEQEKTYLSKVDRIVSISNHMHEILCRDYRIETEKMLVIPNGLSDIYNPSVNKMILRKKWNVFPGEKIILFVGRMDEIKGLNYLIKAFHDVLLVCPRSRLVIAGDGEFDHYTKESQEVCTRIVYTGFMSKSRLHEWYRLADLGVVPSLFEPFGYVALEMMMHGLPIVATATSGLNEVVDDMCGLKVPVTGLSDRVEIDKTLLVQKILYLLQHPVEARKIGQNGRKRYLKEYTSEVFRRNMLQLYESFF